MHLGYGTVRRPAVLCLHQTIAIGKDEPVGLGKNLELAYARELAARGYVALAPDYPNFGEYKVDVYGLGYCQRDHEGRSGTTCGPSTCSARSRTLIPTGSA